MPDARTRRNDGFYFVVVDGVPHYCQWQELKDYLRDSAKVRPGHTNVVKVNADGTRVGFCPLPNKTEANRAFEYLVAEGWRGLDIRVSLVWKSDLGSEEIERRRGPEQSRRRRLPISTPVLQYSNNTSYPPRQLPSAISQNASPSRATFHPAYSTAKIQPILMSILPNYLRYNHNIEHSTSQAAMQPPVIHYHSEAIDQCKHNNTWCQYQSPRFTNHLPLPSPSLQNYPQTIEDDYRSICISRLPNDVQREELSSFLRDYGRISALDIKKTSGQRPFAVARFFSAADASSAIQSLDGKYWRKKKLSVEYARSGFDSISSGPTFSFTGSDSDSSLGQTSSAGSDGRSGPLVVNGAIGPGYYGKRRRDDDSESLGSLEDTSYADERCSCGPNSKVTVQYT